MQTLHKNMSKPIIEIEELGKCYRIGAKKEKYLSLRDELVKKANGFYRKILLKNINTPSDETFWALSNVSFSVNEGEAVGIIGHNGAGKSTLLKILSKITPPTAGRICLRGRTASLLEVGTGFHPELTGRENIYLNGTILGMTRIEIKKKFDEILAFAEVEKFLDTPVKRYSSGMYVRLAFSVAAHLEPEILIVDEVLAVGDMEFQRKCLGKMEEVTSSGRTVLFVSHNMAAIENFCNRCVLLKNGKVEFQGQTIEARHKYLETFMRPNSQSLAIRKDREGTGILQLIDIRLSMNGNICNSAVTGLPCALIFEFVLNAKITTSPVITFTIRDDRAQFLCLLSSEDVGASFSVCGKKGLFVCRIPRIPFIPGQYRITPRIIINNEVSDYVEGAYVLNVEGGDYYGTGKFSKHSPILLEHSWLIENIE